MMSREVLKASIEAKIRQGYDREQWEEIVRVLETQGQEAAERALVTTFFFGFDALEPWSQWYAMTLEQRKQRSLMIYRVGKMEYIGGGYYELYCRSCRTKKWFYATEGTLECNCCKHIKVETLTNATTSSVMAAERIRWTQKGQAYLQLVKYLKPNPVFCVHLFALYQQDQRGTDETLMRELQCSDRGYSSLCFERFPQVIASIGIMRHRVGFDVEKMKNIFTQMQYKRATRVENREKLSGSETT